MTPIRGEVRGNTILLESHTSFQDGQKVEVSLQPLQQMPVQGDEEFSIRGSDGDPISTLNQWFRFAPPKKREKHWKDGRSAKELARSWLFGGAAAMPGSVGGLLDTNEATRGFLPRVGHAEFVTRLDAFSGEHRNHDLIVTGSAGAKPTLLAIEAKADEAFGPYIGPYYNARSRVRGSNLPERVGNLSELIFGTRYSGDENSLGIGNLRYQLLTAVAGAAIEAATRGVEQVIFLIQEFTSIPDLDRDLLGTNPARIRANESDLVNFLREMNQRLGVEVVIPSDHSDFLIGPFPLYGRGIVPNGFRLFVGKVSILINGDLSSAI